MVHNTDDAYNSKPKKFTEAGCNFTFYVGIVFIILGIAELAFGCTDTQKWDGFIFMAIVSWILASLFFVFWYSYNLVLKKSSEDVDQEYSEYITGQKDYTPSRAPDEIVTIGSRRRKKKNKNNVVTPVQVNTGFIEDDFDLKLVQEVSSGVKNKSNLTPVMPRSRSNSSNLKPVFKIEM